jgi:tetratricopeptide (TPR) repeat protein/transglutaminase-like putative cysteine protease
MKRILVLALALVSATTLRAQQPAPAPPAHADEAAIIEQSHTTLRFEEDGTGTRETYVRIKAQSEAGVQQWGQLVAGYNAATERIEIPLVRVHKADGSIVDTPASAIQDLTSPVERIAPVYTDLHQKHVTVQSLRPGDTLEVRMVTTIHTPLAARQFWADYNFNDASIVLDEELDLDVPAARRVTLKTRPGFEPSEKETGGRRVYHWSHAHVAREKKKDEGSASEEPKKAPGEAEWPAVRLTTFADWAEVGRWFSGLEQRARVVSPDVKAKAAELTKGRATDLEKLEALYDFVSKDFRYVSLSLGIGRYQPRAASDVLRDAYGDCKDKHTLLAALVDAAGLQASAALINSSVKIDPGFPSPSQFDHVITRAIAGGQVVWLDATPEVAPFRLLSPDLRARQALVTDVAAPHLEETPADPPMPSELTAVVDGALDSAGTFSAKVSMRFRGDDELPLRIAFRMVPAAHWQEIVERIVKESGLDAKVSAIDVSDPQATRVPFTLGFQVEAANYADFARKNIDLQFPLNSLADSHLELADTDPIVVGGPATIAYRLTLQLPDGAKPRLPLPIGVSRDYGEFRSQYEASGRAVTVQRTLTLKARELPDARRTDLLAFLRAAQNDGVQKLGVDATALTGGAPAAPAPAAEARRLNQSGYEALQARDYPRAIELLKRVTELEPKDKTAWNNLGRAYMGLHKVDDAVAAYRKQIEVNPYDEYAYNNLGSAYVQQNRNSEAEAAFLKQIEVNPLDKYAYSNLGALYITTHAFDKAAAALEKAVTVTPNSAPLYVRLGKAYVSLKNVDKAREAFDHAVELAPTPLTWNDVAYELALGGFDLDRAQQYAESAVSSVTAASRNLDVDRADAAAFAVVNSLAAYWDTLGWVHFAKGDMVKARRYVAAAWALSQHAEVGDHLGQIDERLGQRDKAVAAYAAALSARLPAPEVREHLARAAGRGKVDEAIDAHRGDLSAARSFPLKAKGPAGQKADFLILFSAPNRVEAVKFIEGDQAMQPLAAALRQLPADALFPDTTPARILRRGMAACNAEGVCALVLLVPEDARPVK